LGEYASRTDQCSRLAPALKLVQFLPLSGRQVPPAQDDAVLETFGNDERLAIRAEGSGQWVSFDRDFAHLLAGRQVVNPEPVVALMRPQGTKGEEAAIEER